jgi:hypothetical protein
MAQNMWFNVSISPTGKHNFGSSGDQNGNDLTVSYDGTKMTPANTTLERDNDDHKARAHEPGF